MLLKALLSIKTYLTFKFEVFFLVIPTGYYRKIIIIIIIIIIGHFADNGHWSDLACGPQALQPGPPNNYGPLSPTRVTH
jgi:hypothetical protein